MAPGFAHINIPAAKSNGRTQAAVSWAAMTFCKAGVYTFIYMDAGARCWLRCSSPPQSVSFVTKDQRFHGLESGTVTFEVTKKNSSGTGTANGLAVAGAWMVRLYSTA